MTPFLAGRMHLGMEAAGGGRHPASARWAGLDAEALHSMPHRILVARLAARRGLDFLALPDDPTTVDPVLLTAMIAPVVSAIGLVSRVALHGAEPHRVAALLSDLDSVSSGRAGWEPAVDAPWAEVGDMVAAVAEAGGPAPQPLVVMRADELDALPVAARWADVVRVSAPELETARMRRELVRNAVADAGRHPDDVPVLLDLEIHIADDAYTARSDVDALDRLAGAPLPAGSVRVLGPARAAADVIERAVRLGAIDGVTLVPLVLPADARRVADELVPQLAGRGLFRPGRAGASLRDRFDLARASDRVEGTPA